MKDNVSAESWWAYAKANHPRFWAKTEVGRLQELLELHVKLALETGTDPARVLALLERVRAAILDTTTQVNRGESQ